MSTSAIKSILANCGIPYREKNGRVFADLMYPIYGDIGIYESDLTGINADELRYILGITKLGGTE